MMLFSYPRFFIFELFIFAILMLLCSFWQYKLSTADFHRGMKLSSWIPMPIRVQVSVVVGLVMLFGALVYGLVRWMEGGQHLYPLSMWLNDVLILIGATVVSALKSKFGPLVTGITICSALYFFIERDEIQVFSLLNSFFEIVSVSWPKSIVNGYVFLTSFIAIGGSVYDSLTIENY